MRKPNAIAEMTAVCRGDSTKVCFFLLSGRLALASVTCSTQPYGSACGVLCIWSWRRIRLRKCGGWSLQRPFLCPFVRVPTLPVPNSLCNLKSLGVFGGPKPQDYQNLHCGRAEPLKPGLLCSCGVLGSSATCARDVHDARARGA